MRKHPSVPLHVHLKYWNRNRSGGVCFGVSGRADINGQLISAGCSAGTGGAVSFEHTLQNTKNVLFFGVRNLYDFDTTPLHFVLSGFWLKSDERAMKLVPCKGRSADGWYWQEIISTCWFVFQIGFRRQAAEAT